MTMSTQLKIILDSFNRLKEQKNPSSLEKISNLANLLWSQHLNKFKEELLGDLEEIDEKDNDTKDNN